VVTHGNPVVWDCGARAQRAPRNPSLSERCVYRRKIDRQNMNNARNMELEQRLKIAQLNIEMGDWVHSLAPWQVISHMTFSWEASIDSARRCYEKFMRTEMRGISYFYALEQNPGRDGHHVHALWCDCKNMRRTEIWDKWFHRYGRARIEPVNSRDDVADYCAKYVTKENSWWNVKLFAQRHPAFKDFKLE
jgi:hypothetical protein